jgi:hypothetical protein
MADRYWRGGSGTWDATTTTNWATTSGGAGGASAPTSADNVIFDALSNATAYTVTVGTNAVCEDFTVAAPLTGAVTFSLGATAAISCHGSMTFPAANCTWTATSPAQIIFKSTATGKTITTNGVSLSNANISFNGVGGGWTLGSALTYGGNNAFEIANGTFNTGNFNITGGIFRVTTVGTQVINLGSSTVTLSNSASINFSQTAGLTFNAGTSQITCSTASPTFIGGGQTFYNVSFTSTGGGTAVITGANTFNNLDVTSRSTAGARVVSLGANQTVSGTLTLGAANTSIRRIQVQSDIIGTQRTITLNGTLATLADCDFRDIATAGSVATPWTGTRLGNGLGNSGITFDAAKDVYWNLVAGGDWSGTGWALSSGGTPDANNFPLAQDKAIIENTGLNTSATITLGVAWWIGEFDASTRSNAMTFSNSTATPLIYKNVTLSSAVTMTGTGVWSFVGQGTTQILDTNTATFVPPITVNSATGTLQLAENTTCSATVTLTSGTLDLSSGNRTLTCLAFASNNSNTRVIAFGTGEINVTGNAAIVWNMTASTGFTYTGTPKINLTYSGSVGTRSISSGNTSGITEANALNYNVIAGTDIFLLNTTTPVRNLNFTGFSGTYANRNLFIYGNLTFSSGMTVDAGTNLLTFAATSGTQQITTAGKTLDFPITQSGVGGTVQLQDNLTMGSTRQFTLTNGTFNVNGKVFTAGIFSSSNSNTRTLNLGANGRLAVNGGNWTTTTTTGLTFSGTGTISMDLATAKTFAGGGGVYPFTLNQGGAGTLTITGANTFANITNTNPTASQITFPASTITSVRALSIAGSSGNLVSMRSSTPGTQYTIKLV